ncbi:MAG: ABC transporter permease [Burkholderiales bacterium]|nr:ABC transporter permease [Burkholderiales bacterium]
MQFETQLAVRFLREGRMQSALIVGGVMVGVAVVVFISALVIGLQGNTIRRTLGAQAHVVAKPIDPAVRPQLHDGNRVAVTQAAPRKLTTIENWQQVMAAYEGVPGVVAVSPMASGAGLALRGEARSAITVFGIELARYDRIVDLRDKLVGGALRLEPGDILLGAELAKDLGAAVGDRITVSDGAPGVAANGGGGEQYRIAGLIDPGNRDLSRRAAYLPLHTAQSFLGIPGAVTSIDLRVQDVFAADKLADNLARLAPLNVESWMRTNGQLLSALDAQTMATGMIRVFVSIVVMLGIASVLVVAVVQKTREIGILRAMGASRGQMTRVFLLQGALVGLLGSLLGALLSVVLVAGFGFFVHGADGKPLFPIEVTPPLLLSACVVATLCGMLAAIAPARSASRLDPALAMRA